MSTDRFFVIISIQPWDNTKGGNSKDIAMELSLRHHVLYVCPPIGRTRYLKEKLFFRKGINQAERTGIIRKGEKLWVLYPKSIVESINWIPATFLFSIFNKINSKRFAKEILRTLNYLEFKSIILFNDSSMFLGLDLNIRLKATFSIYYIRDYLTKRGYWARHGRLLEPIIIQRYDAVLTNSELYSDYARNYNPKSFMIGQGCDLSLFNETKNQLMTPPKDAADIPGVKIGYVGYLSGRRLNIELLERIAEIMPEWSIVLVGPEDKIFESSRLHQFNNVYFTGNKPIDVLPSYIKTFDIAINPQRITSVTNGNYPRKIDEYLAMGKPVVCSPTQAMRYFGDIVYLADTVDSYIDAIKLALNEDNPLIMEKRIAVARSHSWANNVDNILRIIDQFTNN